MRRTRWEDALPARDALALLIPIVLVANADGARFAPPDGQAFRHVLIEERDDGTVKRRFEAERTIVFRATPTGYAADVTLVRVSQDAGTGGMFAAGMAGLKGRTIRFQLDRAGNVVAIEGEAAIWEALCHGIESMVGTDASRRERLRPLATPLRALPEDRRRAMLASMITPLIAGPIAAEGARAVTVEARGLDGTRIVLDGRETRHAAALGTIAIETSASGTLPGAEAGAVPARVSVATRRVIDPATGLVLEARDTRDTWLGDAGSGGGLAHDVARTTSTLIAKVS